MEIVPTNAAQPYAASGRLTLCAHLQLEIVRSITEEQYMKKGLECMASSNSSSGSVVKGCLPLKKPLWQKKKEAKIEAAAIQREEEEAAAATPSTLPRGQAPAHTSRAFATAMTIDASRPGAHILNGERAGEHQVCLDPFLGIKLKPHQVEGVKFMYLNLTKDLERSCNGKQSDVGGIQGCILADEMGLGKTIQTIAVIWTMLKQSPLSKTVPIVRKCVVVCPSSLVFNWQKECKDWLGDQRLQTLAVLKGGKQASDTVDEFLLGAVKPVLIISYDMLRRHSGKLAQCTDLHLVVCDEAHKLKNIHGNNTIAALNSLPARRRILLSGTPVQNDLQEFFAMINLVSPGLLGNPKMFQVNLESGQCFA